MRHLLSGIALLLMIQLAKAQAMSMPMGHGTQPASSKNVYLAMMDTMMEKMNGASYEGSPDRYFLLSMVPHHEGAVSMAAYEITHGRSFEMIQLAKSILVEQQSEIRQMKLWLRYVPADTADIHDTFKTAMDKSMEAMMMQMPDSKLLVDPDRAFALVMIPHHQAAIDMARILLVSGRDRTVIAFATQLLSNEQVEIEQMSSFSK